MNYKKRFNTYVSEDLSQFRRVCKCGRHCIVPPVGREDYIICTWCNGRLYRDMSKQIIWDKKCEQEEFRFKLSKFMNQVNA